MTQLYALPGTRLKLQLWESPRYGEWIRQGGEMTCVITQAPNPVNHHLIGHGYSATSLKAPDILQMALSHELHTELHDKGWKAFELKYGRSQWNMAAETAIAAHSSGVLDLVELHASGQLPERLCIEICLIDEEILTDHT